MVQSGDSVELALYADVVILFAAIFWCRLIEHKRDGSVDSFYTCVCVSQPYKAWPSDNQ